MFELIAENTSEREKEIQNKIKREKRETKLILILIDMDLNFVSAMPSKFQESLLHHSILDFFPLSSHKIILNYCRICSLSLSLSLSIYALETQLNSLLFFGARSEHLLLLFDLKPQLEGMRNSPTHENNFSFWLCFYFAPLAFAISRSKQDS